MVANTITIIIMVLIMKKVVATLITNNMKTVVATGITSNIGVARGNFRVAPSFCIRPICQFNFIHLLTTKCHPTSFYF
ncbi:hypothetical protein [Helicobacter acinonychis]|uniref:hypothetical protein n=1 Tax=Helicobacter acinonychis TaxID=212 RepID=UPI001F3ECC25|nr:hypothetical protein [Helicobacter acinonychis]